MSNRKKEKTKNTPKIIEKDTSEDLISIDTEESILLEGDEVKALDHLLKDVPDEKIKQGIQSFLLGIKVSKHHRGPIPDAESLAKYGQISPDLVNRIVGMAEKEQIHRHDMDTQMVNLQKEEQTIDAKLKTSKLQGELKEASRGQWFAFIFVCLALGLGFTAVMSGYQFGGAILGAIGIAGIAAAFIRGRSLSVSNKVSDDSEKEE